MEREGSDGTAEVLASRPNGRTAASQQMVSQLVINRGAQRKSLFARRESKENLYANNEAANMRPGRPTSSGSSSDARASSPNVSKIPRPAQQHQHLAQARRPITLTEAYRMAEAEDEAAAAAAAHGSPSPAPRTWRAQADPEERRRLQKLLSGGPLDFGARRRQPRLSVGSADDTQSSVSVESAPRRSDGSDSDIEKKLKQYEQDQKRMAAMRGGSSGTFNKGRIGGRTANASGDQGRRTSFEAGSPGRGGRTWGNKGKPDPHWLRRVMSEADKTEEVQAGGPAGTTGHDIPIPSIERDTTTSPAARPATVPPLDRSPNKSFAWQADADFTAGDLQISNSPPVKLERNSRLGGVREDAKTESRIPMRSPRPRNSKLDEIRQLEIEAALKYPDEAQPAIPETEEADARPTMSLEGGRGSWKDRFIERSNRRIDEIRAREIESLSKRALATARLDEIRERNSESRSVSPELGRKPSQEPMPEKTPEYHDDPTDPVPNLIVSSTEGERIANTPVTVFRNGRTDKSRKANTELLGAAEEDAQKPARDQADEPQNQDEPRDLLRRLSRTASKSPPVEQQARGGQSSTTDIPQGLRNRSEKQPEPAISRGTIGWTAETTDIKTSGYTRPTVGFAGLRRNLSSDSVSAKSKRSSMAHSDADPTERIEGEMKLFAPYENHSERGSIRAPSPPPESDDDDGPNEETPRPNKLDPLLQPTPRVTGAYVETPVTLKAENPLTSEAEIFGPQPQRAPLTSASSLIDTDTTLSHRPGRRSADITLEKGSASISSRRRATSLPRNHSCLINSAKPPTVKDDLLRIHRLNGIDDSTLDDIDNLFNIDQPKSPNLENEVKSEPLRSEENIVSSERFDPEHELERYERMSKSLQTGLLGIQSAKRGIERLEDKVSHPAHLSHTHSSPLDHKSCPLCLGHPFPAMVTYVHIPVPRLYYREPKFRFTLLGLLLVLLGFWYSAESTMCHYTCRPQYCAVGQVCDWSPEDPTFGYSIPVKLDQWTTGGHGRAVAHRLGEEISDWAADAWDLITGTDIASVDTRYLGFEQKRQHRRRLRKKGILRPWTDPPELKGKADAWRSAREARERADGAREMGYDEEVESMSDDEKVGAGWNW